VGIGEGDEFVLTSSIYWRHRSGSWTRSVTASASCSSPRCRI